MKSTSPLTLTVRRSTLGFLFLVALAVCGAADAQSGSTGGQVFDPDHPATFQSAPRAQWEAIVQEMWSVLTAPQCWDASFIGPDTPAGAAASVFQFSFFGQYQYRYYGFSGPKSATIRLIDVGYYRGKKAVLLSTHSGETEGLILVDNNHFEHVLTHSDGKLFSTTYWTSNGPCL